uniref:CLLAC-motif containing domain-containing protein n=1 Tax=Romanomermis culicivorax TaxID=13658 RepID=A0A915L8B5_ROMCU
MGEMTQNLAGIDGTESGGYGDAAQPIIVIEQHEKGGKDTCLRCCCIVCFCFLILLFAVAVTGFLLLYKKDLASGLFRAKNDTKTIAPVRVITIRTISVANSSVAVAPTTTTLKR